MYTILFQEFVWNKYTIEMIDLVLYDPGSISYDFFFHFFPFDIVPFDGDTSWSLDSSRDTREAQTSLFVDIRVFAFL